MRKLLQLSYLRRVMLVLLLGVIFTTAKSQTTLVAGDLAFTGYNSDNTAPAQDTFAFVVARVGGLSNATVISFTDNGWLSGSSALATSEGTLTWTCSGAIAQGTQVKISANGVAYINNVANGSCSTSGAFSLSSTGDQVLAYQGLSTAPTFIAAIHMNVCTVAGDGADSDAANWDGTLVSSNRSAKPTGLTTGTTAIWFTAEVDNARYKCTTLSGTASAIATAANTTTNWDVDDINPYLLPCSGPANTAPVFLNTTPQALSVCQNASATSLISLLHVNDANASQTMTWTQQSAPTNGTLTITSATAASGSTDITPGGTISYTPTNGYNGSDAFTIRVSDGTATADMVINVTVRALPSVTTSTTAATCSGTGPNISLTASVASSFAWTLGTNTGSITGASASNGTTINQTLTNPSNAAAGSIVYAVTPTSTTGSCVGSATNITVTVNPTPTITLSAVTNVNTSSTSFSLPYTATAGSPNQYSITTGTTAMPSFSAVTNATLGGSPVSVTIPASAANTYDFVVTVKNSTTGCISANNNFTVTVVTPPSITATGTLSAFTTCAGVVSAEQSFTASGSNLTANLVITPPTGFEVSTTSGSGFTTSISLTPSSGSVSSTTIYVRLTTAATGSPSGNFAVASTGGTTQNVAASATVSAAIGANTISPTSQAICSGATPTTITGSTPTGATGTYGYLWMSSTTSASTGFSSASGTNNTKDYSPGTTTAATWYKRMVTSGTCKNDTSLLTTSGVYALSFPGSNAYVSLSGPSGTPASFQGSGNKYIGMWVYPTSANGGLFNFGNSGACYGSVRLILSGGSLRLDQGCGVVTSTITVPNNQWTYVFMSFNSSTQYTVGKVLNGAVTKQNILTSTSAVHGAGPFNIGANTINGNYLVGQLDEVSVWTTNPTDAEIVSMSQTGLTGSETGLIGYYNFNAGPVNTTVTDNSGHNLTGTLTNINSTSGWVTSTLTLASTATVKVNAVPSLSTATTATVCSGLSPNISLTASVASSYAWTLGTNTGSITGASASNGATINQALTNPSNTTAGSIVYTVTPTATTGSCVGSATDITVTVNPKPTITLGTVNNVNTTATSFSLPYSATQGSPNQYSITTGTTAMPSFSAVTNATLPASPISVTIPASAANTYDFIATVKNSTTGCISANNNFTLTTAAGTTISSVDRGTPSGSTTNATSVTYNVTFGASVTGVTASNFTLSTTGSVTGASIGTVSGSGTSWTVAVSTGTGDGSITLNFDNSTGMTPAISTTLPFAGQTYTIDKTAPTVTTQNITAQLNSSGTVTITGSQIDNGSTDASGIATVSVSPSSFTCANAGANTVTLTVTDNTGNTNTGSATVTVADTVKPVATSQNITKYLNAAGTVSVTASQVNNGSTDACGIATLSVSPSSFTCANVGANTVTLTVTDNNGNIKTTTATVTVSDTIRPVATAQNITKYLNAAGTVSITAAQVNNGSTDACGIATLSVSPSSFTCANVGANTVTLTVTDNNGNIKTTTATVTIADTISPVATAQNITKYLNAVGTVSITAAQVNNGSSDACGIATLSVSPSSFTCANVGANTVTLTVTDNNGNVKTTTATVTVTDTISPVATAQNITKYLNAAGTVSITAAQVNNGSSDACGIATLSVSPSSFTCANVGANTVTLTVTDNNGNIKTTTATVTVADTISPVATAQNITKYLNAAGTVSITAAQVNNGSTDACGIATLSVSPSSFTCANVGANTVTLTVTDNNGNIKTATATVTIADTISPVATAQNITKYLNAAGSVSITAAQVNNGSTDACGIATLSVSPSSFTCANTGANTVTLTVTDNNGNIKTTTATVTIADTISPVATSQNITKYLNAAGTVSITAAQVNNGSTDACGIATLSVSPSSFTCANVGANTVTLTVTDNNGNIKTTTATVTIADTISPVATAQNITKYLNAAGTVSITGAQINNGSSDACGIATLSISPSSFTCANVGANTVTLTVTDNNGNIKTATATVTIADTISPVATAQNIIKYLNAAGTVSITAAQVNNGSTDACGIATLSVSPSSFTCANVGANTVTLTVTDNNGNIKTATATVTIADTISPVATAQNITKYLNAAGTVSITAAQVNNGSTDACGIATLSVSPSSFTCANIGANTVTLTVTDNNGNIKTATATVTIADTISPVATAQNITKYLNAAGSVSITAAQVNNGSTDACGIATLSVSPSSFTCANVGANTVTLTVTDNNGNIKTATATVTIADTISPVATAQNITKYLNAAGTVSITAAQVNNGSTDACGIATLSVSPSSFTCANVGANTVALTVTDNNGNIKTATATVTIADTISPVATSQNITKYLNAAGTVSITGAQINNGSSDACGIATLSVSPSSFTCANIGTNTVTLTVTDNNGNVKTTTATVTIADTISPVATAQNITKYLNAAGTVSITAAQVNNGSTDACGIATLSVSPSSFTCANVGANTVTLTVTDNNGNIKTATATVTIADTISPVATSQNITKYLNAAGTVSITAAQVNNGSTDACGIATLSVSPSSFTCANVGANTVTLTVTDNNGNIKTTTATVTIQDTISPVATAQNITAYLNASGTISVTGAQVNNGSSDACGIATLSVSPSSFTCANVGANTVTLTVTDNNGNIKTATATVTVSDTVRPVATAQNITKYLNAAGSVSITAAQVNNGSTDACGIATLSVSPSSFTCANVGANTVTLTVTDNNGNIKTTTATVTIADTISPVATAQNITKYLNAAGTVSITAAQVNNGSTDACGIATLSVSPSSFTCANVGANTVTLTVTDNNGNIKTATATVTIADTISPVATAQNITKYLNAAGTVSITAAQVNNGSTDACGIATLSVSPSSFTCTNVGANTVTLTVTDNNGNIKTATATVTVSDTVRPVATAQNITTYLNAAGTSTITASQVNNGSTDACGIATLSVSPSSFTCANIGANTVTLTVTDNNGNIKTTTATVTVQDTISPVATAQNITAYLNAAGTVTVTGAQVNNGSGNACGIASLSVSPSTFTCTNIGANTVTLTVTDNSGNSSTATATVTVQDTIKPVATTQNITAYLNAAGTASITASQVNNGSTDACGIATLSISPSSFTCANVGANTVTLTVTDNNGNIKTATATVTVSDTVRPVATAQNITTYLNAAGTASITGSQVNNGSTDACGIATLSVSPSSFTCANVGANTVTLTVTDNNGNIKTATATVTVSDTVRPVATTQNITKYLNAAGTVSITAAQVNNGSTDACGIATLSVSPSSFTCANVGANTVTLTVTDNNGNIKTATATVTIADTISPVATAQNITAYLNGSGTVSITGAQVNNGSTDACGIATLSVSPSSFACANIGANTVTLTVTDNNGNIKTTTATVTVQDTISPVATAQNITAYLNAAGTVTITGAQINNGSGNACGIASLSVSPSTFTCANIGANTVTLTVTDNSGNSSTATATVTVQDTIKPVATAQNITTYLNAAGTTSITASQVNNGSTDACGIATLSVSPSSFTCANVGANTVTLTVTDNNGNIKTATATVTVSDTVRPVATAQNITTYLNAAGTTSITASQVNNGSTDACGIATLSVSPSSFTCANVGANTVTLTVTDNNGNIKTATATVTVSDTVRPVATAQNITTYLNAAGTASITASQVNNGSTDACGIATLSVSPSSFTCTNVGANTVTLTVTDNNGNIKTATATVTVSDTVRPVATAQNITTYLNAAGTASITASQVNNGSTDACGIATLSVSPSSFTCANVGANTVTLTVTDNNGNIKTATATVTVSDTVRPVATAQNITTYLNAAGTISITGSQVNNGSTDACGIATLSVSPSSFTCANVGANTVTLTVTDNNGNIKTATATVTVTDTVRPVATAQNITTYLNASGTASITASQVNNGSTDACGIATLSVSPSSFTCTNVGANTVTLTVTDNNGNIKTATATVTVSDTVRPVATAQNITTYLNAAGTISITGSQVNNGSTDACGIATLSVSPSSFTCANVGANTVTLTVTDNNGNIKTATATVTVSDTVRPVAITQNRTLYLGAAGTGSITAAQINNGSTDACGIATLSVSPSSFTCANVGANTVTLTVTDNNGNIKTATATVTVTDTVRPVATPQNITTYLNASGTASITASQVNNGSTDACGIATLSVSPSSFTCANVGANTVTLTVTDNNGNIKTATATVTVSDTVRPVATAQNITTYLNAAGTSTITASQVNNGSTDACGIATLSVSPSSFTCANVGANTVTLTVTDNNGNIKTATATVTVSDTVRPVATAQNITTYLNAAGTTSITASQVNNGSTDACGIATLSVSPSSFTCANVGANTVTLTVTDNNGNIKTATATVTVSDTVRPVATAQNITTYLNAAGTASITASQVNNGSTDACGIATLSVSPSSFTCANVGANTVTLTVTDNNGNIKTATATVTVTDTVRPVATTQNITTYLNAAGTASITASQVNNGSTDACGIATLSVSPSSFTCANVGANTVTLTVTDNNGNIKTATATVTVSDTVRAVVITQNKTIYLNAAGSASVTAVQINNGSTDACGIATVALSQTAFTCSNTGVNTVTLTVTDVNGNIKTGNATVTVLDTIKPIIVCKADTAILDASGTVTIAPDSVKASASDNCSIASASLSKTTFNTTNIGNNSVTLTITDASGNVSTCTTNVLVIEPKPVAICQNATVYLNASGSGTLTVNQVDNGSYSLVGIASRVLSKTSFNCTDLGTNSVKLTVTNTYNNSDSCTSTVTVLDTIKPTVITKTYTTYLNASGTASITAANIDNNSTDNCGVASTVASKTSFNCSNVGSNTVWLIVADASGRKDSASTTVTILDTIKPTVTIQNSVVLYLNQAGSINITPSQFNNGSTDNCSIASTSITPTTITCADLGVKNVTLKVTDVNGNIDSATTSVIVLDPIAPVARPKAKLTVYLSTNGQAVINPSLLDSASTDNCSITSRVLSQSVFNCSNIGNNTISFTVQDQSGNANAASVIITVLDTISPIATVSNQSLYLNASGTASITAAQVNNNSTDNCGVATIAINKTTFSCADLGSSNIIFTVTDINGNSKTASVNVNVFDTIRPVMRPKQFISAYLNTSGTATITVAGVDSASSDNCNIASKTLSQSTFTCANVGINTVTLTGTDSTGNTSGKTFMVTIIDTITPLLSTKPASIYLNATGNVTLSPTQVILSSSDNCSITSSSLSQSSFNCTNLGTNTVNITVTDASSNSKTLSASVTVLDTIKPTVITQNKTIYLNASGNAGLTAAQVNNGSTDNCAIQTTSISKTSYTAVDLGINTITFTATDASSNSQTVNVTVTVLDTTRPIVVTQNRTIYLNNAGAATVTASEINDGSSDNAGINTLLLSKTSFNCNDIGTNTVTLSVSDVSNNTTNATAVVTVLDTIKPTIVAQNISVYLNGLGLATVTAQQANNGSTDNCGISNVTLSKTNFGCAERGVNNAVLSVSDASGNTVTTAIIITVLDTIKPNVVVNNNLNLYLNATGNVSLTTAQVNNGSTDNCGITNLALSKTSFNGTNLGLNIITFTATDASANSQTVSLNVSILDTVRPIVIVHDKIIYLNNSGNAVLTAAEVNIGSTDNVGINNMSINKTLFNCNDVGINLVEFTASDISGNRSSAIINVNVLDTISPVVTFMPADVVFGHCGANYRYIVPTATDNCGEVRIFQTEGVALGNTYPVGITTNVFTFTDKAGNVVTRSFKVTVLPSYLPDTFPSMAVCSSVPAFDLTRGNSNVIFSGSGVSVDGKTFDPSLSGAGNFHITFTFTDTTSCETKGTFVVTVYRAPDKPIIVRMNADVLQVQQIFHSYQWYRNGIAIPGATNQAYTMTRSGVYSVVVGTNQGCSTASDPLGVGVPVGVNNVTEQVKFNIHPNPSSGLFTIDIEGISGKQTNIIVYDALGKQIKEVATHTFTTDLDLTDLAPGTYYVRLNQDNKTSLKPIIIAK